RNSARFRQRLSTVYASETRSGSREFQPSSASRTFCAAVSGVKGGRGGRVSVVMLRSRYVAEEEGFGLGPLAARCAGRENERGSLGPLAARCAGRENE